LITVSRILQSVVKEKAFEFSISSNPISVLGL
jgi:hypothetical protein